MCNNDSLSNSPCVLLERSDDNLACFFGYAEVEIGRLHIVPSVTLFTFQIKFTMLFLFFHSYSFYDKSE